MTRSTILLTNDDGIWAEGLQAMRRELEHDGGYDLYVVAPERERSATGHAITLHKPIYAQQVRADDSEAAMWSVSGTPADATKLGALNLLPRTPDFVLSGINHGANLGMDVLYSGTVSAAIEGAILGIPSIAFSLAKPDEGHYGTGARFARLLVRLLASRPLPQGTLLNVNIPPLAPADVNGVRLTRIGWRRYEDFFHTGKDPRGRTYYWLAGELYSASDAQEGTDTWAISQGYVSISPLRLDLTDAESLRAVADLREPLEEAMRE